MKKFPTLLWAALFALIPHLRAQQPAPNPYDILSRALVPIASVFSPSAKQHALSATLILEEMTDLPPEMVGTRVELLVQPPEHALLRGLYGGKLVTICRAGDNVWIAPNTPPFDALATAPANAQFPQKKKKHDSGLGQMVLPIPPQQLALLPILLQVKDAGDKNGLRTLDVKLMTELARSLGVEEWSLRLSLNTDGQPVLLRLRGPGWTLSARVERLEYAMALPPATWQAPTNAVLLDAQQIQYWSNLIETQINTPR